MAGIDIFSVFERFQEHIQISDDLTLMILKGHLLIEEQIWLLLCNRLTSVEALEKAELTTHQKLCLAEALVDDFSRSGQDTNWLWPALKKLNKLRNDIAHNLTPSGIADRIRDFIDRCPEKLGTSNLCHEFEFVLWNACADVHQLIEPITPGDI